MRYQAFLSYSHQADNDLADALQSALHRFAKPWYRLRALNVFRDKTNLAVSPGLWSTIQRALADSEYFVFLASREAAQSYWVQREHDYWLTARSPDHRLTVLTDGEIVWDHALKDFDWSRTTALPKTLSGKFQEEPLYLDLRWARTAEHLSLRHPRFRDAVADLAAPLHGREKDELIGEDIRQYRRTRHLVIAAVSVITVLLLVAIVMGYVAVQQRNEARQQQRIATEQRDESRRRLVQLNVNNGLRLVGEGDLAGGLVWYADAAQLGQGHPREEELLGVRFATTLRQHPVLAYVWFHDQAVQTAWLEDGRHVVTFLKDGSARVWDAWTGKPAFAPLQRADASIDAVRLVGDRIHVLSTHVDDTARVWDAQTGSDLAILHHQGKVTDAAFSADGTRVVSASEDGTARVWDSTGRQLLSLPHDGAVVHAAFSVDGRKLLTFTEEGKTVHVWDATNGAGLTIPVEARVLLAEFSPDGGSVLTLDEQTAVLWDATTGNRKSSLGQWDHVKYVRFSPDGKRVAIVLWTGWVGLWDLDTDTEGKSFPITGLPLTVSFSADGQRLVTSSNDFTVRVWNVQDAAAATPLLWHDDFVYDALLSPDGKRLVTAGAEKGVVRVWELNAPAEPALKGRDTMRLATFSRDGTHLLTTTDFTAQVWDTSGESTTANEPAAVTLDAGMQLYHAAFSPDGGRVVTCSEDGIARLWDAHTGKVLMSLPHAMRVEDAAFTPDGTRLATASDDQVCVWDTQTGHKRLCMGTDPQRYPVLHVEFDREGKHVLGMYFGGTLRVWEVETGTEIPSLNRHDVHRATYSPDGKWIATAENGATVHVMSAATGVPVTPEIKLMYRVTHLVFSPDSARLLTADEGGVARLWNTASAVAVTPPLEHRGRVMNGAFSPDGSMVVTVSTDVRVWDAATGVPLAPPRNDDVRYAEFSPNGHWVVTAGEDGVARVRDVSAPTGSIDDLMHLASVYAVRRLDEGGALTALTTEQFREAWQALHAEK